MNRTATIRITLRFSPGVQITLDKILEVSLDCPICKRLHRTIMLATEKRQITRSYRNETVHLSQAEKLAVCTPTLHTFPARLVHKEVTTSEVPEIIFRFEYESRPFIDHKGRHSSEIPTWARVSFTATCPQCRTETCTSTQTNLVRPYTKHCSCGYVLYVDVIEPQVEDVKLLA